MKSNKKLIRKLRSKERAYYRRLKEPHRRLYIESRNKKLSVNKNRKKIRLKLKSQVDLGSFFIAFPEYVDIYHQPNVRKSLRPCNAICTTDNLHITLDFRKVKRFSAAITAYLKSTIIKAKSMDKVIRCKCPRNEREKAVLQKVGIFDLISGDKPLSEKDINKHPDVGCWYQYTGTSGDPKLLYECVHEFTSIHLNNNESVAISKETATQIEINIKELIGNVIEHAYSKSYRFDKSWVLYAMYQDENEHLVLVISDSGLTIPKTYIQYHKDDPTFSQSIKGKILEDGYWIKRAVQDSKSGTDKPGRGKGFERVERSIDGFGGSLIIYSKKGCYVSKNSTTYSKNVNLIEPVNGTIVTIELPLESLK